MKQILVIFLALFVCNASAFWRACHIAKPLPTTVTSPLCTATSCTFTRGQALAATITFTPTAAHQTIETFVRFQAGGPGGIWQSIPVSPPANNACAQMTPGCPTVAGRPETFNLNIPIPTTIAAIGSTNFEIWLAAILPTPADVFCIQVTAVVL